MNASTSGSRVWSVALSLIPLLGCAAAAWATPTGSNSPIRSHSYSLPLTFEANQGQADARVDFLARGVSYTLFLTPAEAVFSLSRPGGPAPEAPRSYRSVMRMQLVNSARDAGAQGLEQLPGKVNYLRGNDSAQWRTNVHTYKRVKYTAVYPGIDLVYYGQPQQLEYDFLVAPGADPSTIKLAFAGVDDATVDARGDLVLKTGGGPLRFQRPAIYQTDGSRRDSIEGGYVRMSPREIGFRVGDYDRTRPLIIDPVLTYSTFLGGTHLDEGRGIAVDATGAAYVTGSTLSADFPTANALQPTHGDFAGLPEDAFVAKLTPDGRALVYATYLGGNDQDIAFGIAVDPAGAAVISGLTLSPDFPTVRALQVAKNGGQDAFVAKLSADGSRLVYSTYLGGRGDDSSAGIAVDLKGAAYIAGETSSPDFPTTAAFQPEPVAVGSEVNGFVAKLKPDGSALAYSSYLGGSDFDSASDIALDSTGSAYVTGTTASTDFPTVSPLQPRHGGLFGDAFVTKVAPDGKRLTYSTYIGGNSDDQGRGIAVDLSGAAYVTGRTQSSDFPTMNPVQPVITSVNAFVAKLAPGGGSLMYGTYLGKCCGGTEGQSIAVDSAGAAYAAGGNGDDDAFVTKFAPDGKALLYQTVLGGSKCENAWAVAVDLTGAAYITGYTCSRDFPTMHPLQATHAAVTDGGITDAFVTKLAATGALEPHVVVSPESADFPAQFRDIKFGEAVAIRNGIAFVGSPQAADGGHVALLNLTTSGWKRVGTIKLPQSVAHNIGETAFGRVLTWRDGVLMVGGNKAAYYFSRRNGIWTFREVLQPAFLSPGSVFPLALRYERGDVDIAGSPQLHGVGTLLASEFGAPCCPSRVHIFHLSPTRQSFLYIGAVQPSDSRAGDNFGADLSMTSREFVVGSPRGSRSRISGLPAYNQSGAAYIFRRGTDGRWKQGQKLLPSEPAPGFGTSVAIDNDMIIVGAPKIDIEGAPAFPGTADGHTAGGAAYVFVPGATRYIQALKLRPRPDELFQYQDFGYRIAMFGSNVAIAAVRPYEADSLFPSGLAVAYRRDGTSLQPRGIAQGHVVAASMGLANNWLLLGVPYERFCPRGCIGSAHIYDVNRLAP